MDCKIPKLIKISIQTLYLYFSLSQQCNKQILQNLECSYYYLMSQRTSRTMNFVDEMNLQLTEYQLQKALKMEQKEIKSGEHYHREKHAKQALIQLDEEADISKNTEQDIYIGRWSNYKVPEKPEQRLSLSKKTKRSNYQQNLTYRYLMQRQRGYMQAHTQSEHTIPKLKVILHQLECPLDVPPLKQSNKARNAISAGKMKNHIGPQALVISNKQEIKPSIKSARKTLNCIGGVPDILQKGENKRPDSGTTHFKGQPASSGYQKIKRSFGGNTQQCELLYQKEILSQLIKGNINKPQSKETGPLASMLNYFTMSGGDTKKKVNAKLGLDRLLC